MYVENILPKKSYSTAECELIEDGILKHGLKPELIACTEILVNFTQNQPTINQMVDSDKFSSVLKMQKYLKGLQLFYIEKLK